MVHPSGGPEGLLPSYAAGKERAGEGSPLLVLKCQDEELGLLPEGTVGSQAQNVQICVVERASGSHEQDKWKEEGWEEGQERLGRKEHQTTWQ